MDKYGYIKWIVLGLLVALSLALIYPPSAKIRKGLDIQGGYSFTLQLDEEALSETIREENPDVDDGVLRDKIDDAVRNADDIAVEVIRNRIDPLGVEEPVITKGEGHRIYVQLPGATEEKRKEAERSVRNVAMLEFRLVHPDNNLLVSKLFSDKKAPRGYTITSKNGRNCYVQSKDYAEVSADQTAYARELATFNTPNSRYNFMLEKEQSPNGETTYYHPIYVERRAKMTGKHLVRARPSHTELGEPCVSIEFDTEGAIEFGKVTEANVNRQLAIVLDGTVYSAPNINEPIMGGNAQISGRFSIQEVNYLCTVLNAGALPAPLKFIGQRFVAPTLGEDAIRGAGMAILFGVGAIMIFMLVYYGMCGLVANVALILDLILLPVGAILVSGIFGAIIPDTTQVGTTVLKLPVLTLPGIAGILLTLGMAVDANVLIFERVREEQNADKTVFPALMAGYNRAFLAIFDSNLTTVITAVILFIFGSGLIRGFSIMLTAGIIVSMYTALMITKLIFRTFVKESSQKQTRMLALIPAEPKINFMRVWKPMAAVAVAIIVGTLAYDISRGVKDPTDVFAVDFTGGAKITYTVADKDKATIEDVRKIAYGIGISDAAPQFQTTDSESYKTGTTFLEIKTVRDTVNGVEVSKALTTALQNGLPEAGIEYTDIDEVGSQIGKEMSRKALLAIGLSLLGMIIYISLRFEFGFAIGAIVALVHDVLITVGIYLALGRQMNLTTVAALLTIVGYSVNDTIVIFDRIREEMKVDKKSEFKDLVNRCINVTLGRTLITSMTTAFTVVALLIFATGDIRDFAVTMMIGIIVGVFSTIFIATPAMLCYHRGKRPDFQKK